MSGVVLAHSSVPRIQFPSFASSSVFCWLPHRPTIPATLPLSHPLLILMVASPRAGNPNRFPS